MLLTHLVIVFLLAPLTYFFDQLSTHSPFSLPLILFHFEPPIGFTWPSLPHPQSTLSLNQMLKLNHLFPLMPPHIFASHARTPSPFVSPTRFSLVSNSLSIDRMCDKRNKRKYYVHSLDVELHLDSNGEFALVSVLI